MVTAWLKNSMWHQIRDPSKRLLIGVGYITCSILHQFILSMKEGMLPLKQQWSPLLDKWDIHHYHILLLGFQRQILPWNDPSRLFCLLGFRTFAHITNICCTSLALILPNHMAQSTLCWIWGPQHNAHGHSLWCTLRTTAPAHACLTLCGSAKQTAGIHVPCPLPFLGPEKFLFGKDGGGAGGSCLSLSCRLFRKEKGRILLLLPLKWFGCVPGCFYIYVTFTGFYVEWVGMFCPYLSGWWWQQA